jgi:hypothetical protein
MKKRRKYLVYPRLQLEIACVLAGIGAFIMGGFGFIVYRNSLEARTLLKQIKDMNIKNNKLLKESLKLTYERTELLMLIEEIDDEVKSKAINMENAKKSKIQSIIKRNMKSSENIAYIMEMKGFVGYYILIFVITSIIILFIAGIIFSHRIAGPVYVILRDLERMIEDEEGVDLRKSLRKKDKLKDLHDTIIRVIEKRKQSE